MPLKGWIHPLSRERVPFNAFDKDTTLNGRPAFPPWAARMAAHKAQNDMRHTGLNLTTTACLTCPRQLFIERTFPYWIDPTGIFVRERGTAMHSTMAEWWPTDGYLSEDREQDRPYLTARGTLFGIELEGLIDAARYDERFAGAPRIIEIIDGKFPSDWSVRNRRYQQGKAKDDHQFQMNVNRLLLAQQPWAQEAGYDPDTVLMTVWDHANGNNEGPHPYACDHWSEEQMLQHHPGGGEATVEQIIDIFKAAKEEYEERTADAPETIIDDQAAVTNPSCVAADVASKMPLVGASMYNKSKCPRYCDVEGVCAALVAHRGVPCTVRDLEE